MSLEVKGDGMLTRRGDRPLAAGRLAMGGAVGLRAEWEAEEVPAQYVEQRIDPGNLAGVPGSEGVGVGGGAAGGEDDWRDVRAGERD